MPVLPKRDDPFGSGFAVGRRWLGSCCRLSRVRSLRCRSWRRLSLWPGLRCRGCRRRARRCSLRRQGRRGLRRGCRCRDCGGLGHRRVCRRRGCWRLRLLRRGSVFLQRLDLLLQAFDLALQLLHFLLQRRSIRLCGVRRYRRGRQTCKEHCRVREPWSALTRGRCNGAGCYVFIVMRHKFRRPPSARMSFCP